MTVKEGMRIAAGARDGMRNPHEAHFSQNATNSYRKMMTSLITTSSSEPPPPLPSTPPSYKMDPNKSVISIVTPSSPAIAAAASYLRRTFSPHPESENCNSSSHNCHGVGGGKAMSNDATPIRSGSGLSLSKKKRQHKVGNVPPFLPAVDRIPSSSAQQQPCSTTGSNPLRPSILLSRPASAPVVPSSSFSSANKKHVNIQLTPTTMEDDEENEIVFQDALENYTSPLSSCEGIANPLFGNVWKDNDPSSSEHGSDDAVPDDSYPEQVVTASTGTLPAVPGRRAPRIVEGKRGRIKNVGGETPPSETAIKPVSSCGKNEGAPTHPFWTQDSARGSPTFSTASDSVGTLSTTSLREDRSVQQHHFKVFLLLLQPASKIFELIQLIYDPHVTTVGGILSMIPQNATESALGQQKYLGLTRPKKRSPEFTNLEQLASSDSDENSAGIRRGEMLVAIPYGFTARHVVRLGKQILASPRIQNLLALSDPHAFGSGGTSRKHRTSASHGMTTPTTSRNTTSSSRRSAPRISSSASVPNPSSRRRPSHHHIRTMDIVKEEEPGTLSSPYYQSPPGSNERRPEASPSTDSQYAIYRAMLHAELSNKNDGESAIPLSSAKERILFSPVTHGEEAMIMAPRTQTTKSRILVPERAAPARGSLDAYLQAHSQSNRRQCLSLPAFGNGGFSNDNNFTDGEDNSLSGSFSSWSMSFDSSLASSRAHSPTNFQIPNKGNQKRRLQYITKLKRAMAVTCVLAVGYFFVDPNGYAARFRPDENGRVYFPRVDDAPMGVYGLIQFVLSWMALVKFQRFFGSKGKLGSTSDSKLKCPFLQTSHAALERFHKRYCSESSDSQTPTIKNYPNKTVL